MEVRRCSRVSLCHQITALSATEKTSSRWRGRLLPRVFSRPLHHRVVSDSINALVHCVLWVWRVTQHHTLCSCQLDRLIIDLVTARGTHSFLNRLLQDSVLAPDLLSCHLVGDLSRLLDSLLLRLHLSVQSHNSNYSNHSDYFDDFGGFTRFYEPYKSCRIVVVF